MEESFNDDDDQYSLSEKHILHYKIIYILRNEFFLSQGAKLSYKALQVEMQYISQLIMRKRSNTASRQMRIQNEWQTWIRQSNSDKKYSDFIIY